jgi:hypothetical protein
MVTSLRLAPPLVTSDIFLATVCNFCKTLQRHPSPQWQATVNLPASTSFTYKYIRKDAAGQVTWEYDPNRSHTTPGTWRR